MKRFWKEATAQATHGGWQVMLDGRPIRTQAGAAQVVPTPALAEALAEEWAAQGEEIDPGGFVLRDLADYAIDQVAADPAGTAAGSGRQVLTVPEAPPSQVTVIGEGAAAAPALVSVLRELGVVSR